MKNVEKNFSQGGVVMGNIHRLNVNLGTDFWHM